jgi:hypothetical protein
MGVSQQSADDRQAQSATKIFGSMVNEFILRRLSVLDWEGGFLMQTGSPQRGNRMVENRHGVWLTVTAAVSTSAASNRLISLACVGRLRARRA